MKTAKQSDWKGYTNRYKSSLNCNKPVFSKLHNQNELILNPHALPHIIFSVGVEQAHYVGLNRCGDS